MDWKIKAAIQNGIARLPGSVSYATYYRVQRLFGGLRVINPVEPLAAGIETWKQILAQSIDPTGRTFFEVGTGRAPVIPLAFWLMGAGRTITVDVNPYLRIEIVRESLDYIRANQAETRRLFGNLLQPHRMDEVIRLFESDAFSLTSFLDLCRIDYVEPGDAARTGLPDRSIDFHTSNNVFEHIPPDVLLDILREGNRIVRRDGLFVHMVDYSDHFSHDDRSISAINFLQYSDERWNRYAGNRYMYTNRLRHDDVLALFEAAGHQILATTPDVDPRAQRLLEGGELRLHDRFASKSSSVLSIRRSWIVSRHNNAGYVGGTDRGTVPA